MIINKMEKNAHNYQMLFDLIPVSTFIIDPSDATVLDVNQEALNVYKYDKDELIGMKMTQIDQNISKQKIKDVMRALHGNYNITFEAIHTTKDDHKINIMVNISKIIIDGDEYFFAVHTDISNDIKIRKELQKHKSVLESIVSIQNELISGNDFKTTINNMLATMCKTLDIERAYIYKNKILDHKLVCSQIFEYTQNTNHKINEKYIKNMPYKDYVPRWMKELSNNKIIEGVTEEFPKDEKEILEGENIKSIIIVPIFQNANWSGFIGLDDCTKKREWSKLEKDMLKTVVNSYVDAENKNSRSEALQKTIASQNKHLNDKDKILLQQSKQAQMGEMINMIAHQWRQPLNTISATAISLSLKSEMDMLEKSTLKENTHIIQEQCQKMSSTINTFMSFVKPHKEQKPFKLSAIVDSILKIMGTQLINHNINVNTISTNDKISVVGHKDLLEQVLINLLSNSRDAFESLETSDKYINITFTMQNNKPLITIEDNAGGIDDELKDKVFNPYFTTKEQGKGSGLGLYISKDIMQKSFNGNLTHQNTQNGSIFKVIFG